MTSFEELYNWGRSNSVWPLQFGLACCAIEMIAASMAKFDIARLPSQTFLTTDYADGHGWKPVSWGLDPCLPCEALAK